MKNIVIMGASGHSKVIIDIIEKQKEYNIMGLLDDKFEDSGEIFCDYKILGKISFLPELIKQKDIYGGLIAIGDNWTRFKVYNRIINELPDFIFVTAIHPSAHIGRKVNIGKGTVLMAGSIVNSYSTIGDFCIINTGASIDHDNKMNDFSSVAPGAVTGGNVEIGFYSAVSIGATIIHNIKIGNHTVIGAGSTVLKDIPPFSTAYGTPAKVMRKRSEGDNYL